MSALTRWWPLGSWWSLPLLGALTAIVAAWRRWSPWWGGAVGALVWGGALLISWERVASWHLATRFGALFGGAPPWGMVAMVPFWAALLVGLSAKWVHLLLEREG